MSKAKAAPRAIISSDVTRPRLALLAALGGALGAGAVLVSGETPVHAEKPLARPHQKVACRACHDAANAPKAEVTDPRAFTESGACKSCHPAHASTRAGHKNLAAKGVLSCASCHPAHAGAQGITFGADGHPGTFLRWGAGAEATPAPAPPIASKTTVPLVAVASCTRCHDATRSADPIAGCLPANAAKLDPKKTAQLCFDEHGSTPTRFVVWDAAREIATTTPWVAAQQKSHSPWLPAFGAVGGALLLGLGGLVLDRKKKPTPKARAPLPNEKKRLPMIDEATCLGCYACVDACPFDVLTIEKYVAVVARPEECCGVVLCEQVCPNGSLTIAEGEPILDRPQTDEHLESRDVPGLFLAGDLTGLPLIKNAINQGVRAVDRIASTLPRKRPALDLVIVGAGPAGLSAALRAKEKGLSCVVLEQATVASSIKSFPRAKLVYDPPLDLPVEGELWLGEATKEDLLAQWMRIVRARALDVREGRKVESISKVGGGFHVTTATETIEAARVIVAIGRRGIPKQLDARIDESAENDVHYALADARSFAGKRMLVVGLGDSAMEAAVALARQPETSVTMCYRGATFRRGKQRNVSEVEKLVRDGKIRILFETSPESITKGQVVLAGPRGRRTVQIDAVLVSIGGTPSWDVLARFGIRRPAPGRKESGPPSVPPQTFVAPGASKALEPPK